MDIEGTELEVLRQPRAWNRVWKLCFEYTCSSGQLPAIERALTTNTSAYHQGHCCDGDEGNLGGFTLRYPASLRNAATGSDGIVFCTRSVLAASPSAAHIASANQGREAAVAAAAAAAVTGAMEAGAGAAEAAEAGAGGEGGGNPDGGWWVEPDRVLCVGGRFAGLWVLRRSHIAWDEL